MTDYLDPHFVRALCRDPERRTLEVSHHLFIHLFNYEISVINRSVVTKGKEKRYRNAEKYKRYKKSIANERKQKIEGIRRIYKFYNIIKEYVLCLGIGTMYILQAM